MDSKIVNKNPSLLPRRNPVLDTGRTTTHPDVDAEELEAMNRLRQIETRTQVVSPRGPRRNPSVFPRDTTVPKGDVAASSIEKGSATTKPSAIETGDSNVNGTPLLEIKREGKKSTPPKPIFPLTLESKPNEDEVEGHTGTSLPVRGFGRHESKVPPATGVSSATPGQEVEKHSGVSIPIKAFGRHESKVPPYTAPPPNNDKDHNVEKHIGNSLPVKAFSRHESKVPNSFVATGEGKQGDPPSIVPPSTISGHELSNTAGHGIPPNSPNSHSPKPEPLQIGRAHV